jgi:hypothetical protein
VSNENKTAMINGTYDRGYEAGKKSRDLEVEKWKARAEVAERSAESFEAADLLEMTEMRAGVLSTKLKAAERELFAARQALITEGVARNESGARAERFRWALERIALLDVGMPATDAILIASRAISQSADSPKTKTVTAEEERAAVVRYLRVWAKANQDNEEADGPLQAIVSESHASNIERGAHHARPAADAPKTSEEP